MQVNKDQKRQTNDQIQLTLWNQEKEIENRMLEKNIHFCGNGFSFKYIELNGKKEIGGE